MPLVLAQHCRQHRQFLMIRGSKFGSSRQLQSSQPVQLLFGCETVKNVRPAGMRNLTGKRTLSPISDLLMALFLLVKYEAGAIALCCVVLCNKKTEADRICRALLRVLCQCCVTHIYTQIANISLLIVSYS